MIVINGSHGEGGGALVRTAIAVSSLTQIPVRIHHVRGGTRKPGLTCEDLTFIAAATMMTSGEQDNVELGSLDFVFQPLKRLKPLRGTFDPKDFHEGKIPGNALMIAQSLLPLCVRAGGYNYFKIRGETFNPNTLVFDGFLRGTLAAHALQGIYATATQIKPGWGFAGHGEVDFEIEPSVINPINATQKGEFRKLTACVSHAHMHGDLVEKGIQRIRALAKENGLKIEIESLEVGGQEAGFHAYLQAEYEQGFGSGQAFAMRGLRPDQVVETAWEQLANYMEATGAFDPFLADQLLVPAAFAEGASEFTTTQVTTRLQTIAWIIRQFMPIKITVLGRVGEPGSISVNPQGMD